MIRQLSVATGESYPSGLVLCLEHVVVPIALGMVFFCIYLTLAEGVFGEKFTGAYVFIGMLLLFVIISPLFYYYFRFRDDEEVRNPYTLDLKTEIQSQIPSGKDKFEETPMTELNRLDHDLLSGF